MKSWKGKRVLIVGAARQGTAAARYLARHGAQVTLNDRRPEAELTSVREALAGFSVRFVFGGHPLDLLDEAEVVCISGGVPLDNPLVAEAMRRNLPLTNDTQIFMEVVPCRTVGITGSAGKTTTTALVGAMAKNCLGERAFVGGNIGDPLLNYVDEMRPDDLAILEISSFQLEQMTLSPQVAAVLNITPNHLDRHGTMEAYIAAKKRILDFQTSEGIAVLGREDAVAWSLRSAVRGRLVSFGFRPLSGTAEGTFLVEGILHLRQRSLDIPLLPAERIQLRGQHNLLNVLAAFAIGNAAGLELDAMLEAAESFRGVPHRLELVRERDGVRWYNDSIATAPERTIAAIRSFEEPLVLLLGGRDKNLPWDDLARLVHERVRCVVLFGEAGNKIRSALEQAGGPETLEQYEHLEEAVQAAARLARPGEVVLLSPGATSFDEFRDFEARGEAFRKWVLELS
ncbi:MAG: UDP-N-acetylmuramoyl-L-alanine--D-glutamate ligase [Anaerolineales bacterium]|nr:UDP-N-acetylmuramoyl-L-alanine--D-glutamate ligase [Anaerolineales bacterium]MDW8227856.1 UDP-N-acetylmuramoyl-L-alanine--D-glutamate ligase [Anaerolineales bacterium]